MAKKIALRSEYVPVLFTEAYQFLMDSLVVGDGVVLHDLVWIFEVGLLLCVLDEYHAA